MLEQQINLYKNFTKGRIHYTIQLFEIIKITNHAEAKKQPTQTENITSVHLLDAPRKSVSFKCNERLWKSFVSTIKAQGLSVCHVMEGIIYGYLHGTVHLSSTIKPLKIENLVVERAVKRVRRYGVEGVEGGGGVVSSGKRKVSFYDVTDTVWREVEVDDEFSVNSYGHLVGCGCNLCRGLRGKR